MFKELSNYIIVFKNLSAFIVVLAITFMNNYVLINQIYGIFTNNFSLILNENKIFFYFL